MLFNFGAVDNAGGFTDCRVGLLPEIVLSSYCNIRTLGTMFEIVYLGVSNWKITWEWTLIEIVYLCVSNLVYFGLRGCFE